LFLTCIPLSSALIRRPADPWIPQLNISSAGGCKCSILRMRSLNSTTPRLLHLRIANSASLKIINGGHHQHHHSVHCLLVIDTAPHLRTLRPLPMATPHPSPRPPRTLNRQCHHPIHQTPNRAPAPPDRPPEQTQRRSQAAHVHAAHLVREDVRARLAAAFPERHALQGAAVRAHLG
jgi:hypothetical protein